ncbi:penicillin acylase family protein [Massilia timonae]|uniref:Penicillin amidase family protein n=1 Tax=Massilia timonae TaxID=47229 RepID=A0A1S2NG57_9BURK|nr:penicillin acylase family protein [Massilia timonae]OIJ44081.1 penicillin amidase family protein [Massilia timonae]
MSGSLGKSRWKTWTLRTVGALLALVLLALLAAWLFLRASLAQLDGEHRVAGLVGQVKVERDAAGVPLISGASRLDVAYATGFVHGQERFFQMDLLRRTAAGELAELFGAAALPTDRTHRLHRFRARALDTLARLPAPERALLERYAQGVNEGLGALRTRPFEYALTGAAPRPWTAPDSLLVVWAMYIDLQGAQQARELARGWLRAHSDAAQLAFLLPEDTPYDATLDATPDQGAPKAAGPLPPRAPAWWGAAPKEPGAPVRLAGLEVTDSVGSNNYALAGSRSSTGAAIVADDMHLGLRLPNIWYRLALRFPDPGAPGGQRRLAGVSLPGAPPSVIVGSNGQVAWAFTNSYADSLDLVELRVDPARPNQVGLPGGWETPREHVEEIAVKGAEVDRMVVRETSLGPIREVAGRSYALHWIAHDPAALNMNHLKLESVANVGEALAAAASNGIPAQNFVAGDVHGNIGWTVAGLLPRRAAEGQAAGIAAGIAAGFPLAAGSAAQTWSEALPYADYPRIVNPAAGQITTANSRQLSGAGYALLGDGGYDLGQRNRQLHEGLQAMGDQVDVRRAFDGALDDRAILVGQWRQRALAALDAQALAGHPQRAEFRRLLETSWSGRASVESIGYRLARDFMWSVHDLLYGGVNAALKEIDPKASAAAASARWPAVAARLLDERPQGWLPAGHASWRDLQLAAVDRAIAALVDAGTPLAEATWGRRNTADIAHPISMAVPALRPWLAAPGQPLAGDAHMPRVAGPKFGQSERLTVSPGREEEGLYNMPGGQSGHPLSPFFLLDHAAWIEGKPAPLLPGAVKHTLRFVP